MRRYTYLYTDSESTVNSVKRKKTRLLSRAFL
jgi:hypothetical protein